MKSIMSKRFVLNAVAAALLLGSLSACIPLVVGGAVVGGTLVANDRRTSGAQLEDEGIELRSSSRIRSNVGDRVHVDMNTLANIAAYPAGAAQLNTFVFKLRA